MNPEKYNTLIYVKTKRFLLRVESAAKNRHVSLLIAAGTRMIRRRANNLLKISFQYYYNLMFNGWRTFVFQGNKYRYFFHGYNTTWRNERKIEVPIILRLLRKCKGDVLEVGNVLSYYSEAKHDIVDKYERGNGVITMDINEASMLKQYDLIISISTLEHIGWDENPDHSTIVNCPDKILIAVNRLRALLKPKGQIVITVPIGYNPHLDKLLVSGKLRFDKQYFMKRVRGTSNWIETSWDDVKAVPFDMRVPTANAIMIGIIESQF